MTTKPSSKYYVLDGRNPVPCSLQEWADIYESKSGRFHRQVARTQVGESLVSTVFLGLDHNFGDGPPTLFETLVFGGPAHDEMRRCSTYDEAERNHRNIVALAAAAQGIPVPDLDAAVSRVDEPSSDLLAAARERIKAFRSRRSKRDSEKPSPEQPSQQP